METGGANRDRTDDLLNAIQALSQLSYGPTLFQPDHAGWPACERLIQDASNPDKPLFSGKEHPQFSQPFQHR